MLTLNEVSKKTGHNVNFIRLCKNKLGDILNPYIYRGDKNKLLFDDSVISIFDKVGKLKDDGLSMSEIVHGFKQEFTRALLNENKNKLNLKQAGCFYDEREPNNTVDTLLKNMIYGRVQALEVDKTKLELEKIAVTNQLSEKEKRIKELEKANLEMKSELRSLPYGRTPEQIRADYETNNHLKKEKMRLLIELKNTGCFSFLKRRRIIKELMEYL